MVNRAHSLRAAYADFRDTHARPSCRIVATGKRIGGAEMKRTITTALVLAALAASGADAWASKSCIAPKDATALEVATVQQQLMVAPLTSGNTPRSNPFV